MGYQISTIEDSLLECSIAQFSHTSFKLDSGFELNNFKVAFKTFGKLNGKKNNAILVCHALSGDQYVTEVNPITKKDGWWSPTTKDINEPVDGRVR